MRSTHGTPAAKQPGPRSDGGGRARRPLKGPLTRVAAADHRNGLVAEHGRRAVAHLRGREGQRAAARGGAPHRKQAARARATTWGPVRHGTHGAHRHSATRQQQTAPAAHRAGRGALVPGPASRNTACWAMKQQCWSPQRTAQAEMPLFQNPFSSSEPGKGRRRATAPVAMMMLSATTSFSSARGRACRGGGAGSVARCRRQRRGCRLPPPSSRPRVAACRGARRLLGMLAGQAAGSHVAAAAGPAALPLRRSLPHESPETAPGPPACPPTRGAHR